MEEKDYERGELKYNPGEVVYVFQSHSKPQKWNHVPTSDEIRDYHNVDKKYIVGKDKDHTTQKWCKVEIIEPIFDESGWERYKVKQLDGYRKEKEFVAYQDQMSKFNHQPISIGFFNPDEILGIKNKSNKMKKIKENNEPGIEVTDLKGGINKKLNNLLDFEDFGKTFEPEKQKKTKRTEVGLDIVKEEKKEPGIEVDDLKGGIDKKLNNLLDFDDFAKTFNPEEQKKTKRTDVGLDIVKEDQDTHNYPVPASLRGKEKLPDNDQWMNRFEIESSSSDRIYIVSQNKKSGIWGCSCPAWRTRRRCKHLDSLGLLGSPEEHKKIG